MHFLHERTSPHYCVKLIDRLNHVAVFTQKCFERKWVKGAKGRSQFQGLLVELEGLGLGWV